MLDLAVIPLPSSQPSTIKRLALALLLGAAATMCDPAEAKPKPKRAIAKRTVDYGSMGPPDVGLKECESPSLRGVRLHDQFTERGRMERSMRWKNITDAVERRYGIPNGYLVGMIAQEAIGDPTMPNLGGDGGLGLIHMQPLVAHDYGLEMITRSRKLRDFKQGNAIKKALRSTGRDLVALADIDDRWHPVKNIDAAGRILADHYQRAGSWTGALRRYSGRPAYEYANPVIRYAGLSKDGSYLAELARDFNSNNRKLIVWKRPLTYQRYLNIAHAQNECQFGLVDYKKLPRVLP